MSLQQQQPPQLSGNNIINWARKLVQYLSRTRSVLVQKTGDESAAEDGIVLFDRALQAPVISINGEFVSLTTGTGGEYVLKTGDTMSGSLIVSGANITVNGVNIGIGSGSSSTNTIVGRGSGEDLSSGSENVAIGSLALQADTTGNRNTALGAGAMRNNLTGNNNTAVGQNALYNSDTINNTAVGRNAAGDVTGSANTYLGKFGGNQGGIDLRTESNHIVLSDGDGNARFIIDGSGNSTLTGGITSGGSASFTGNVISTGNAQFNQINVGRGAGNSSTNTIVGRFSGENLVSGSENSAVGNNALRELTTSSQNTAIGAAALKTITQDAPANTAVGHKSLEAVTLGNNTAIGAGSGRLLTGSGNTYVGKFTGLSGAIDLRTLNNHIVLSDGDANPRMIIDSSGNAAFQNEIGAGGKAVLAGGATFGQDTEEMSNYKKGTWVPVGVTSAAGNSTIVSITDATYIRTGDFVFVTCSVTASCADPAAFRVEGLPFTVQSHAPAFSFYSSTGSDYGTSNTKTGYVIRTSNQMRFAFINNPTFTNQSMLLSASYTTTDA